MPKPTKKLAKKPTSPKTKKPLAKKKRTLAPAAKKKKASPKPAKKLASKKKTAAKKTTSAKKTKKPAAKKVPAKKATKTSRSRLASYQKEIVAGVTTLWLTQQDAAEAIIAEFNKQCKDWKAVLWTKKGVKIYLNSTDGEWYGPYNPNLSIEKGVGKTAIKGSTDECSHMTQALELVLGKDVEIR